MRRLPLLLALGVVLVGCSGRSAGPALPSPAIQPPPSLESLPSQGIAVEVSRRLRPELILIGINGRVLERPKLAIDSESQVFRNVLVLRKPSTGKRFVVGPLGELLPYRKGGPYPRLLEPSSGGECSTFAHNATRRYELCGDAQDFRSIVATSGVSRRTVAAAPPHARPPPLHVGSWRDAYLSPDGTTVLATWSVECESPTAFFVDTSGEQLRAVTGEKDWRKAPESVGLGWTRRGLAVVQVFEGLCGNGYPKPGIYVVDPRTGGHRLIYEVRGAYAVFWRR